MIQFVSIESRQCDLIPLFVKLMIINIIGVCIGMKTNQLKEETTVSNINTRPKPEGTSKKSSILQVYCLEHFEGVYQILNIVSGGIKLFTYDSTNYINYNLTC